MAQERQFARAHFHSSRSDLLGTASTTHNQGISLKIRVFFP